MPYKHFCKALFFQVSTLFESGVMQNAPTAKKNFTTEFYAVLYANENRASTDSGNFFDILIFINHGNYIPKRNKTEFSAVGAV